MTKRPPTHRDHSRPVPRVEVGELDDTADDAEDHRTPVEGVAIKLADRVRADLEAEGYPFSARDVALLDALSLETAQRLAEMHAAHLAASPAIPPRVRELELKVDDHDAKHRRLTGEAESNGRIGRIEARIPATLEERLAEKSTIGAVRWTTIKVLGLLTAASVVAGGGIWTSIQAGRAIARAEGARDQHEIDQDRRLNCLEGNCTTRSAP